MMRELPKFKPNDTAWMHQGGDFIFSGTVEAVEWKKSSGFKYYINLKWVSGDGYFTSFEEARRTMDES